MIRLRHPCLSRQLAEKFRAAVCAIPDNDAAALVGDQRFVFCDLMVGLCQCLTVLATFRLDIAALAHEPDDGKQRRGDHADEKRIGDCFSGREQPRTRLRHQPILGHCSGRRAGENGSRQQEVHA